MAICTVQVTNICPKASHRQMKELFSYLGDIDEIRLFPEDEDRVDIPSKVCFVTYKERSSVETALHLSNTIFIDRALIISQSRYEVIPDESVAMSLAAPAVAVANPALFGNSNSTPLLPTPQSSLLGTPQAPLLQNPLASAIEQAQAVATSISANLQSFDDVNNSAQNSAVLSVGGSVIPSTPTITGNVDPTKIDEIRRTIYVGNLSSTLMADQVMGFFQTCGEIRYVRMAGDETQPTRFAFVEFTNPESVQIALQYNGAMFGDRPIKVNHSKNAIVKPQGKTPEMAQREVDEAMRKVRQATHAISTAIEPGRDSRSRSRSRSRERRRSRSRDRRKRSPSRERYRRRSPSWSPRHRGYSPYRGDSRRGGYRDRRSRSRSPPRQYYSHRRRSPERDRRRRSYSKSRSPSPRRKSSRRNKDRDYEKTRERDLSATPSPSPERKKSKKSKKEKKHKKQRSPSVSLSPSPPPREREEKVHYSDNSPLSGQDDDRHTSPSSD